MKLICDPEELPALIRAVASLEPAEDTRRRIDMTTVTWGDGSTFEWTPLVKEIDSLREKRDVLVGTIESLRGELAQERRNLAQLADSIARIKPGADAQLVVENAAAQIEDLISVVGEEYPGKQLSPQMWEQAHEVIEKWHSHVMREVRILAGILGEDA